VVAGCGNTKTVTVSNPRPVSSPRPTTSVAAGTTKQAPPPSTRTCSPGVTANAHASCPFAERILAAYAELTGNEPAGGPTFRVISPTTQGDYFVHCSERGHLSLVACSTPTGAEVTLTYDAVGKARSSSRSSATPPANHEAEAQAENSQRVKRLEESKQAEQEARRKEEREQECLTRVGVADC
jgi:hypothetical protein